MGEGIIGIDERGMILGLDRAALAYIGLNAVDIGAVKIQQILDSSLDCIFDRAKKSKGEIFELRTYTDKSLFLSFALSQSYRYNSQEHEAVFTSPVSVPEPQVSPSINEFEPGQLRQFSRIAVEKTLQKTGGNVSLAAKLLGISRNTLYRYLKS
jgi:DNA-binding NtrC family response regulator